MPSSVLSHQAPALILKIKYPKKFDGTALCLSTILPDIDVILGWFMPFNLRGITHSFLGLVLYTVPFTLILTIIFCSYIGPFFAKLGKRNGVFAKPLKYFGIDEWDYLKEKKYNRRFFIVASYSALIGGLTHLFMDFPSHEYVELFFPIKFRNFDILLYPIIDLDPIYFRGMLIDVDLTVYRLIWSIETLITLVISLYLLRYMKKHKLISNWYRES